MGSRSSKATASVAEQATGWNPDALCDGLKAADRAKWVVENCAGYSEIAAQQRVMGEFPASFLAQEQWNPDVDCGGHTAAARVQWLVKEEHLSESAARHRVMMEFPHQFGRVPPASSSSGGEAVAPPAGSVEASGVWDPAADCDGHSAASRAAWVMNNAGATEAEAQALIMKQFPQQFGGSVAAASAAEPLAGWDPAVLCGDSSAGARAKWLVENQQLSSIEAQRRVMSEFPHLFGAASTANAVGSTSSVRKPEKWDDYIWCGGVLSSARAKWLVENKGMSVPEAQRHVMGEFRAEFDSNIAEEEAHALWNDDVDCDGISAIRRMKWHTDKRGATEALAKVTVVREFASLFKAKGSIRSGTALLSLGGGAPVDLLPQASPSPPPEDLVWSDEFDYTGPPDASKWDCDSGGTGWGNNELQFYTDRQAWETQEEHQKNAWVSNGMLRIVARRQEHGGRQFTSARLVSRGHGEWLHGRVEAKMRLPTARGSWPAFWMLPTVFAYGPWPDSGEIDIMEHVGHDPGVVHGTVHTGAFNHMKSTQVGKSVRVDVADWHTYAVTWTSTKIEWFIDGARYHSFEKAANGGTDKWPFDRNFFILLNVAVGGSWGGQKGIDEVAFDLKEQSMDVAWVRVYKASEE
mmetsp:Transcript_22265/g.41013  ORF Transcript_22265/g.41013 Transcript_22265/m.41013 type:complete len:635 (+) Transcript_22265:66-1970(+)